jgi:hypothetical protein
MPKSTKTPVFVGVGVTCDVCQANGAKPCGKAYWDSPIAALGGSWGYLCRSCGAYRNTALATRVTTVQPVAKVHPSAGNVPDGWKSVTS